jgi:plasmid stability protein
MTTTLTIRNLDESVKQKLRVQAATHGRSMAAEAREILARAVAAEAPAGGASAELHVAGKFNHLRGTWKGRLSTDETMLITRGE